MIAENIWAKGLIKKDVKTVNLGLGGKYFN